MSFLSRIKEMGKTKGDDEVPSEALSTEGMVSATGAQVVDTETGASTIQPGGNEAIISESAPSEFPADYQRQNEEISEASLIGAALRFAPGRVISSSIASSVCWVSVWPSGCWAWCSVPSCR